MGKKARAAMATGSEMLAAVRADVERQPGLDELHLSVFDAYDLFKLKPSDLESFGLDPQRAEAISGDLLQGSLIELGKWLGVPLIKEQRRRSLIPGEDIRRTAGVWAAPGYDPDAIVEEVRQLRMPHAQ